jgi:hypothetical protein
MKTISNGEGSHIGLSHNPKRRAFPPLSPSSGSRTIEPNLTRHTRPKSSRAHIVMAICETLIALVTCFGVFTFFDSIQRAKVHDAQETVARLYKMDLDVNSGLGTAAEARTALYSDPSGTIYRGLTAEQKSVFQDACAGLGGVFEYYLLIRDDLQYLPSSKEITQSWDGYMESVFQRSYGFRGHIKTNQKTWTPMLLEALRKDTFGLEFPPDDE